MNKNFTISNFLSALRLLLTPVLIYFLLENNTVMVFVIILIASVSDILDGYLARKLNQITELGKIIDPLGDKVMVFTFCITLFYQGKLPLWFFLLIIIKDLLILLGGMVMAKSEKNVPASDKFGKAAVILTGFTFMAILGFPNTPELIYGLMYAASLAVCISFFMYSRKFYKFYSSK
jgi:cardiolipin synthase (CMP-forming)